VTTADTPGSFSAALTSIFAMRAWATGLRRIAQWSIPVTFTLSMNSVRPVTRPASSTRFTSCPTKRGELTGRSSGLFGMSTAMLFLSLLAG
jgi:hypothetical protein